MTRTVILGAGLTGMRAGIALAEKGHEVTLIEKEAAVGGIARSIAFNGYLFDHGPHGFHSYDEILIEEFKTFVGEDRYLQFEKKSRIYYNGAYFDYPLRIRDLAANMSPNRLAGAFFSYMFERTKQLVAKREPQNAEDYLRANFGRAFYNAFFGPYTERVWGIHPSQLAADFIEDRVPHVSLWGVLKQLFFEEKQPRLSPSGRPIVHDVHWAYYPKLGIQLLSDGLHKRYGELGGRTWLSAQPIEINTQSKTVTVEQDGIVKHLDYDQLISTIPLDILVGSIQPTPAGEVVLANSRLKYRPVVLVCLCVNKPEVFDVFWVYYAEGMFNRISETTHFSSHLAPPNKTGLCVEFSTTPEELASTKDETFYRRSMEELKKLELIEEAEVEGYFVIRERHAYPLYHLGYKDTLRVLKEFVSERGIETAGRQGDFSYINMDQAMASGKKAAERVFSSEEEGDARR